MPKNEAERGAQERQNIPKEKAGFDYISRGRNWDNWDSGYNRAFRKGKKKDDNKDRK